jgi:four helix bundle protein
MNWPDRMRKRTRAFALAVIGFCRTLPHTVEGDVFRRQLLKSGTSVGANYRAACRGRSPADKRSKMGIALEEADESQYWLDLLEATKLGDTAQRTPLLQEATELAAILTAAFSTMSEERGRGKGEGGRGKG